MLKDEGSHFGMRDPLKQFSIQQSIAKMFSLSLVYKMVEDKLRERVDIEPSGTTFDSIKWIVGYDNYL
ncbi:glutaminase [Psychroserpens sp.]|uniref:glutaminase n=1 Tax=Psychroserpens sp. TaxID=2020870 RepID=UPI0039E52965